MTNRIIPMVTLSIILSVKISRHHTIYLFEFYYNTLHNVVGIYRWKFSIRIFTEKFYRRVIFVGNCVYKTYTLSYYLLFYFFFNGILSAVNTIKIFLSLFTYKFREEHCFFQTKNFNYVIIRLDWIMFVCVYLQYCRQNHWADAQY